MKTVPVEDILRNQGLIDNEQLNIARESQKDNQRIDETLVELGFVSEKEILYALSTKLDEPIVDLANATVDMDAVALVPELLARKYNIIAIEREDRILKIVTSDPMNFYGFEDIRLVTEMDLYIMLATSQEVDDAITFYYSQLGATQAAQDAIQTKTKNEHEDYYFDSETDDSPVVKLLNSLLLNGYNSNASDIHIEPFKNETIVRMRVDGMLVRSMTLQRSLHDSLVVRTKILSNLDISEKRLPQDGHFVANIHGKNMNLRVSIVPTFYGEKIVLRYLNSYVPIENGEQFGMNKRNYLKMQQMMSNPHGIIYVTGPTGSGKTTTLYMIMEELVKKQVNIMTIEDPVEKNLDFVNQIQVNDVSGLTFETGLKAILRQDPDIIMIGETRDSQTASISIRAAITGHLVVSTLHTNNALSSIIRLEDMGIEPYLVANGVVGIVAQRLVRKVCPICKKIHPATEEEKKIMRKDIQYVVKGEGCPACHQTGYKGRVAVHEMVMIDSHVRKMISDKEDVLDIEKYIIENQDYHSLFDETLELVEKGETTIEELLNIATYNL